MQLTTSDHRFRIVFYHQNPVFVHNNNTTSQKSKVFKTLSFCRKENSKGPNMKCSVWGESYWNFVFIARTKGDSLCYRSWNLRQKRYNKRSFNFKCPLIVKSVASWCSPLFLSGILWKQRRKTISLAQLLTIHWPMTYFTLKSCQQTARCVSVPAYHKTDLLVNAAFQSMKSFYN